MKKMLVAVTAAMVLAGCDRAPDKVIEKDTTVVNPSPADQKVENKKVENNTTIINPPASPATEEKKTTTTTTTQH